MIYTTTFDAFLVSLTPPAHYGAIRSQVAAAQFSFNALPRRWDRFKRISVQVLPDRLRITLYSAMRPDPREQLRFIQYFSKELSLQPGMTRYICHRHLLRQ